MKRATKTTVAERARWRSALLLAGFAAVRCRSRRADSLSTARRQGLSRGASERSPSAYGADLRASRLADGSVRRAARRQHARRLDLRQSERAEDGAGPARRARRAARSGRRLARASHHEQSRARIRLPRSARRAGHGASRCSRSVCRASARSANTGATIPRARSPGHVIGFTNVDDRGQEGLEAAFDYWLKGESGSKRVLQDRRGQVIRDVELLAGGATGARLAHEHRSANPISRLPRAQGGGFRQPRAVGLGRRARPANRRSARDGQSAGVQPERPVAISARKLSQPRGHRHLRARLELQAARDGRGAGERRLQPAQHHRHVARLAVDQQSHHHRGQVEVRPHRSHDGARAIEQRRGRARRFDDGAASDCRCARAVRDRQAHR